MKTRLIDFMNSQFVVATVMFLTPISVFAVILGVCEGIKKYDRGGCTYETIMDYYPFRSVACELIRKRWAK